MSEPIPGYCEKPPDFEFREGMVHVTIRTGGSKAEYVMRPCTFIAAIKRSHRISDEIAERRVLPLPRRV